MARLITGLLISRGGRYLAGLGLRAGSGYSWLLILLILQPPKNLLTLLNARRNELGSFMIVSPGIVC